MHVPDHPTDPVWTGSGLTLVKPPPVTWRAISARIEAALTLVVLIVAYQVPWFFVPSRFGDDWIHLGHKQNLEVTGFVGALCLLGPGLILTMLRPYRIIAAVTGVLALAGSYFASNVAPWAGGTDDYEDLGVRATVVAVLAIYGVVNLARLAYVRDPERDEADWFAVEPPLLPRSPDAGIEPIMRDKPGENAP